MKQAGADLRKNKIFIFPVSKSKNGIWGYYGFAIRSFDVEEPSGLGEAIVAALDESTMGEIQGPRTDDERKRQSAPLFEAAGLKTVTWKSYAKDVIHVSIRCEKDFVEFIPSARWENKSAVPHPERAFTCPLDPGQLGPALLKAFALCGN